MGAIILRILLLALGVWLVRSFLASILGTGKTRSKKSKTEETGVMVKDPVCGMYMDSRLAVRLDRRGKPVYFCSENCKLKYLSESTDKFPQE
ncbi:MAG: YHS domain-containing protein [Acidobacteriota bacterium]|jgi:YHS domain-containing protein|nr:YHS domain-containing protein [Acidobacteriota bacterium]